MSAEPRILLLRGVNAGAGRGLTMADLRCLLEGLGGTRVRTVLQSGNAVFCAPVEAPVEVGGESWGARIAQALAARLPFAPEAFVYRPAAFAAILAANPFAGADPRRVQIGFLARPPEGDTTALAALAAPDERFIVTDAAFYLHAPSGIGRSRLAAAAERRLGVPMTLRNARVAADLAALVQEYPAC